jgi:hypothetical protein
MTMHLLPPMYSTTGKKKGPRKFRNAAEAARARELDAGWTDLLAKYPPANIKTKKQPLKDVYKLTIPEGRSSRIYKSVDTGGGSTAPQPTKVYTGDKMKGIGTMHKSNMVPIFSNQEAEDISKMRRG